MGFLEVISDCTAFRRSLRGFVGENALDEIQLQIPAGNDEASFFRLVSWSYVLVFEAGRVVIPFLFDLPHPSGGTQRAPFNAYDLVRDLRTWSVHNLTFSNERNVEVSKRVDLWFIDHGGASPPATKEGWENCFEKLCAEVRTIVSYCKGSFELVLSSPDDREDVINDLNWRVERNWPAWRFDALVQDATTRIGRKLDVRKFREPRLPIWRQFLDSIPANDDPVRSLTRLIERDVLDHFASVLPIDGNDVMDALDLSPGPQVGEALLRARRLHDSGITEPSELLRLLNQDYQIN